MTKPLALLLLALFACKAREETKPISADPAACSCAPCAPCAPLPSVVPLDLPKAEASGDTTATLNVVIAKDAKIVVDGSPVADDAALLAVARKSYAPDKRVVILADRAVAHGVVIHVLDVLKSAGFTKIAFAVSPS